MVAADFNFDGRPDLGEPATSSQSTGTASVWLNTGTPGGGFSARARLRGWRVAEQHSLRRVSEFYTSLVTANYNGSSVTILARRHRALWQPVSICPSRRTLTWLPSVLSSISFPANRSSRQRRFELGQPVLQRQLSQSGSPRLPNFHPSELRRDRRCGRRRRGRYVGDVGLRLRTAVRPRARLRDGTLRPRRRADGDQSLCGRRRLRPSTASPTRRLNRSGNTVRVTSRIAASVAGVWATRFRCSARRTSNGNTTRISAGQRVSSSSPDLCSSWCPPHGDGQHTQAGRIRRDGIRTRLELEYVTMPNDVDRQVPPARETDAANWARSFRLNRPVLHADRTARSAVPGRWRALPATSWGPPDGRALQLPGVVFRSGEPPARPSRTPGLLIRVIAQPLPCTTAAAPRHPLLSIHLCWTTRRRL